jgi:hypothetical protein
VVRSKIGIATVLSISTFPTAILNLNLARRSNFVQRRETIVYGRRRQHRVVNERQVNDERAADVELAFHADVAVQCLNDCFADAKSKSVAGSFRFARARLVGAVEALENPRQHLLLDTFAVILDKK